MLPAPGTYPAKTNGQLVVYESEKKGSLCVAIPVKLRDSDPAWAGRFTCALFLADGTAQVRTIENLKRIFGWDGADPFWLMDQDFSEIDFDVVGEHEPYTPEDGETRITFKVKYLNPTGEGGAKMPAAGDRKSILAKYGSKFRALAGSSGAPAPAKAASAPSAAKNSPEPAAPSKAPGPKAPAGPPPGKKKPTTAGGQPPTSTMEEAWEAFVTANPGKSEDELGQIWYATIEELCPGKNNSDLTIQEWGAIKSKLG